ncbi:MAG: hypothetical protein AAF614_24890 [Chloroflexota bacterium]
MYVTNPVNIHQVAQNMQHEKLQAARRRHSETAVRPQEARRPIIASLTRARLAGEFVRIGQGIANISLLNFML